MCEMRSCWRVGIAQNAVFSIVLWLRWLGKSAAKNGRVQRIALDAVAQERFGSPKSFKTGRFGAFFEDFEVQARKIWRESDLEAKIVTTWQPRSIFGSSDPQNLHQAAAREQFGSRKS